MMTSGRDTLDAAAGAGVGVGAGAGALVAVGGGGALVAAGGGGALVGAGAGWAGLQAARRPAAAAVVRNFRREIFRGRGLS